MTRVAYLHVSPLNAHSIAQNVTARVGRLDEVELSVIPIVVTADPEASENRDPSTMMYSE
jgi:hypothetical protein